MNSPEIDFFDGLKYDYSFTKNVYSCVNKEFLQLLKKVNDGKLPEQLYICGIDTDCCVLSTDISLFENSIKPIVLENFCASNGGVESHKAGIKALSRLIGNDNITTYKN